MLGIVLPCLHFIAHSCTKCRPQLMPFESKVIPYENCL